MRGNSIFTRSAGGRLTLKNVIHTYLPFSSFSFLFLLLLRLQLT